MNVASLENCEELFKLSGWEHPDRYCPHWIRMANDTKATWRIVKSLHELDGELLDRPEDRGTLYETFPAYDTGYLLRKLPKTAVTRIDQADFKNPEWTADTILFRDRKRNPVQFRADTPEDALCKLAIQLWKQGILTNE